MEKSIILITTFLFLSLFINAQKAIRYTPDDPLLYTTILKMDSLFFHYYNTCSVNLDKYAAFYTDSIEFYHDNGGLTTSKAAIVEGTRKNICGKVTRQLIKESVEVYPIKNFGAIEIGYHSFHNSQEPNAKSTPGRFVIVWQQICSEWKIKRVISLH
jgi:hypothetical protein